MELDAWQLAATHKLNLENLTTLAQLELLNALEYYRGRPVAELLAFLSSDVFKLLKPFEELGRQLSVDTFKKSHALAAANPATPVQPMEEIVVAALGADRLTNRGKGFTQAVREMNSPDLLPEPVTVIDVPEPVRVIEFDDFVELPADVRPPVELPKPTKIPPAPQTIMKEKVKAIKDEIRADIKADKVPDIERVKEKVAEATQSQVFNNDRENLAYYADLEKTIKTVKRIPSSGGCAWCKSAALFMDGDSKSHKYCKCTTGYIYEGEDDDKFMDDEQREFRDNYEKAQEQLKNGETHGRLLKQGTHAREVAMKKELKDAAYSQAAEVEKAEAERLGRSLKKGEIKELHRQRRKQAESLAKKLNSGDALSLEEKQTLHGFGRNVEEMRAPKYGQTQRNEDVLAVLRREQGYR
jgi:hypothetical protein